MLVDKKIIEKLPHIEERYNKFRYEKIEEVPAQIWETYEHYVCEPGEKQGAIWSNIMPGVKWGDNWLTAWFRADVKLPANCTGKKTFIRAKTNGETLFITDGRFKGVFDDNHPIVMMTSEGMEGKTYHLAFEAYAGHYKPGCGPDENDLAPQKGCKTFEGIEVVLEREDVSAFIFDFRVLIQLIEILDENSLRRNKIAVGLAKVYQVIDVMPNETPEKSWRPKLLKAREIMTPLLDAINGSTAPRFGIVGHSHIDTAWLWPVAETWRKCARTFSSVLNLMEQYPEFKFVQSTPYQTSVIRERYPEIYNRIKEKVKEGRWEPNGAMWVEPDCNVPSGESFVRQLLVGQNATREMFGYTSDTLWLPDVFGYSAALPQILKGCRVEYFCTTKLDWNDTNRFPYDTFVWKGIDGTSVISHFHNLHCSPDPKTLDAQWKHVQHKDVQDRRLIAIGYGDGGGGPTNEMIEISRRVKDLEGCPRTSYTTVSEFMNGIKEELIDLPQWSGELYLELHRGTLTSIAKIKRGNRKCEIALRDAEFLCTLAKIKGLEYPKIQLLEVWKKLLLNQFHDILPGSSIARVNDEAIEELKHCLEGAEELSRKAMDALITPPQNDKDCALLINNLSWERSGELTINDVLEGYYPENEMISGQWIENIEGNKKLIISGINIPSFGSKIIPLVIKQSEIKTSFKNDNDKIETHYAIVKFDEIGRIISLIDKDSGREIVKSGGALNTLLLGEDVPAFWDNWDIDRDQRLKMGIETGLLSREIVSNGPLQLRIRSSYKIGVNSSMMQDMIFHADSPQIDFETKLQWSEKHKLFKVGFDLEVFADYARHEIQYGYVERPTHENLPTDRARFESCNHKWTDLSEAEFGVAILNDCKYGIGVKGSEIRLSLMKSGIRPDPRGDLGEHMFTYSIVPHNCGFSVKSVVRPAYELNIPVISTKAGIKTVELSRLFHIDAPNIIAESIKWSENGEGFILRLYDAGKTGKKVNIKFNIPLKEVVETNLLEEELHKIKLDNNAISMYVKPFEIKTFLCEI